MDRVSAYNTLKSNFLITAPHGFDDTRSDIIAETIIQNLDCFGVVNHGWQRAKKVDALNDLADCNNLIHCNEDVVREEFLEPIERYGQSLHSTHSGSVPYPLILHVHGMGPWVLKHMPNVDVIIGYGVGDKKSRLTCDKKIVGYFCSLLKEEGFNPALAGKDSWFGGYSKTNLNQLELDQNSLQLEFISSLRSSKKVAKETGEKMTNVLKRYLNNHPVLSYNCPVFPA